MESYTSTDVRGGGVNMVDFFEGLSLIGWIGVLLWVMLPVAILSKQDWFFNYDRRKPKMSVFEEYCYTYERQVVFMAVRFLVIVMVVIMVGKVLTAI